MSKATVTRLFVGGVVAGVAGFVLGFGALIAADAGGAFVMNGADVTGITGSAFAWAMGCLMIMGLLAIIGGSIAGLVAWIGALLNTATLDDKTWFVVLLVLGIWNLGFIAMIAYLIAGPAGAGSRAEAPAYGINEPRAI